MQRTHPCRSVLKYAFSLALLLSATASGKQVSSLSYTGTLATPQSIFETTFALSASATVTFQTWGFGGGANAAGTLIGAGGFDPLIALFTGPPASANMYYDGLGNPLADADNLLNFPWSFVGNCPLAGSVAIGGNNDCGDDFIQVTLPVGSYTLVLTDANYIPNAIYDNGALSEGFSDFTAGVFQTCDASSNACISPNANYAVDIVSSGLITTPEPATQSLVVAGFAALGGWKLYRNRRTLPQTKGANQ